MSEESVSRPDPLISIARVEMSYSGPLPPPKQLADYEAIVPGTAERVFRMAEIQQEQRMELERAVVLGNSKRADRGQ